MYDLINSKASSSFLPRSSFLEIVIVYVKLKKEKKGKNIKKKLLKSHAIYE